jgi:voltage-gated sodium channel
MMLVIIINMVMQGIDVSTRIYGDTHKIFDDIDKMIVAIFVVEIILKLYAKRFSLFKNGWDIFDLIIVIIALIPDIEGGSILRSLRILRSVKMLSTLPKLRVLIDGMLRACSTLLASLLIFSLFVYIFAILCIKLFGAADPEHFGTLIRSLMSLYTLTMSAGLTHDPIDSIWSKYSMAWLVFIPYIVLTSFALLNVFVSIFCAAIYEIADEERAARNRSKGQSISDQIAGMQSEIQKMSNKIDEILQTTLKDNPVK